MYFDAQEMRKLSPSGYTIVLFASPVTLVGRRSLVAKARTQIMQNGAKLTRLACAFLPVCQGLGKAQREESLAARRRVWSHDGVLSEGRQDGRGRGWRPAPRRCSGCHFFPNPFCPSPSPPRRALLWLSAPPQLMSLLPEEVQKALSNPLFSEFQHLGDDVKKVFKAIFSMPPIVVRRRGVHAVPSSGEKGREAAQSAVPAGRAETTAITMCSRLTPLPPQTTSHHRVVRCSTWTTLTSLWSSCGACTAGRRTTFFPTTLAANRMPTSMNRLPPTWPTLTSWMMASFSGSMPPSSARCVERCLCSRGAPFSFSSRRVALCWQRIVDCCPLHPTRWSEKSAFAPRATT